MIVDAPGALGVTRLRVVAGQRRDREGAAGAVGHPAVCCGDARSIVAAMPRRCAHSGCCALIERCRRSGRHVSRARTNRESESAMPLTLRIMSGSPEGELREGWV